MIFQQKTDEERPLHQSDITPNTIKQRHIDGLIIFTGLESDLPDGGSEVEAFFSTDTNKLFLYNGTSWVSVSLS